MALEFYDRVKFTISNTPGTGGTFTQSTASSGSRTLTAASAYVGASVPYLAEEGTAWETGIASWGGTSLTRIQTIATSASGVNPSFTSAAVVSVVPLADVLPRYSSGAVFTGLADNYLISNIFTGNISTTGATPIANTLVCMPFFVGSQTSFNRIGVRAAGSVSSATNFRLGIWRDRNNGNTGQGNSGPGVLLVDAGAASVATSNTTTELTINVSLKPGLYWLGLNAQATTANLRAGIPNTTGGVYSAILGLDASYQPIVRLQRSMTYGSFGDETSNSFTADYAAWCPIIHLRRV